MTDGAQAKTERLPKDGEIPRATPSCTPGDNAERGQR